MNIYVCLLGILLSVFGVLGCKNPKPATDAKESASEAKELKSGGEADNKIVVDNGLEYIVTASGKKIPKADKGITLVSENGWTVQEMEFQMQYCQEMLQGHEDVESAVFCKCFLEKIQYYYKPIYLREAYDDQMRWNAECIEAAQK